MNIIKTTITAAAVIACCLGNEMPAGATSYAELRESMNKFCTAVKKINRKGMSAAPGTQMAALTVKYSGKTAAGYQMAWDFAKGSNIPSCSTIY